MNSIIDYVNEYGDRTCVDREFCEADALVLCQLSYFKWDKLIPPLFAETEQDLESVLLKDICENIDAEYVYKHELFPEDNERLIQSMVKSPRFMNMKCNYYLSDTRVAENMQFAAMTFRMEGALPLIVFRGTDGTIVGWKEDFHMAFSKPYAGAYMASRYVGKVAERYKGDFMVAGHSKGGNMAAFSAMNSPKEVRERITDIYSFDGPGFRPEILAEYNYNAIASRVHKYLPKSSLVGIVLEGSKDYVTIKAHAVGGALQHNPYKWCTSENGFVEEEEIKKKSQIMHKSLNDWIMELDEEDIALVIDSVFDVLESADVQHFPEILKNRKTTLKAMKNTALGIDKEKRKKIRKIIGMLLEAIYKTLVEQRQEQKETGIKPV